MNDSEFDHLLRTTRDEVPLPPRFHHEVWHRIESAEQDRMPRIVSFASVLNAINRPWPAAAGIAATVAVGAWLGAVTVPEAKDAKLAYAESISPFAHHPSK